MVATNTFSDETMQQRFHDGKATESVGLEYQLINEIEYTPAGTISFVQRLLPLDAVHFDNTAVRGPTLWTT